MKLKENSLFDSDIVEITNEPKEVRNFVKVIEVMIPRPLITTLYYTIDNFDANRFVPGCRVIVPLGRGGFVTAIVLGLKDILITIPLKNVYDVLEDEPIFDVDNQMKFFTWMSKYYICSIGEVLNVGLPVVFKISSESKICLHEDFDGDYTNLSNDECCLIDFLVCKRESKISDARAFMNKSNFHEIVRVLYYKRIVFLYESVKDKVSPKFVKKIKLSDECNKNLKLLITDLEKYPKQLDVLLLYLSKVNNKANNSDNCCGIEKTIFKEAGVSMNSLETLIKKGIFVETREFISRFSMIKEDVTSLAILSRDQLEAYDKIVNGFKVKNIALLFGVSGSGKTEIYMHLIDSFIKKNQQVLYIMPEIAVSVQLVARLQRHFSGLILVYHSKISDQERAEIWKKVSLGEPLIIVSVKSGIFLPFKNLGLIIVDEEHDCSLKHNHSSPRYNARDAAMMLAVIHNAKVLLGSATPSLESYYNGLTKKFELIKLDRRYGSSFPNVKTVNTIEARREKKMTYEFTKNLIEEIERVISNKEQVLIFQNKRGYAVYLSCDLCGWIPECVDCSIALTYYNSLSLLKCNYCGFSKKNTNVCQRCNSSLIKNIGFGTEKIEESLKVIFPNARIARIDQDTVRTHKDIVKVFDEIDNGNIDIIVGTQMLSKGLDFEKLMLVGIIQVDYMLNIPDFRSHEKCFQIITQLCGRVGRKEKQGLAIIQSTNLKNQIIKQIKNFNYNDFFESEIVERSKFGYPPFYCLIKVTFASSDFELTKESSVIFFNSIKHSLKGVKVLFPSIGYPAKLRSDFIFNLWIKIPKNYNGIALNSLKLHINETRNSVNREKKLRNVKIIFDVDPI